jgi:succinoglycan biosynthesis transport protein ExoP
VLSQVDVLQDNQSALREYVAFLRTHKWLIAIVTVVIVAISMGLSIRQTPLYQSSAEVLVKPIDTSASGLPAPEPNLETERSLVSSETVAELAADRLDYDGRPAELLDKLSVGVATSTEILDVRFTDPSKRFAQSGAQAFAEGYLEYRRGEALNQIVSASETVQRRIDARSSRLEEIRTQRQATNNLSERVELRSQALALRTQVAILQQQLIDISPPDLLQVGQIVGPADFPGGAISPNYVRNLLLAVMAGLGLGVAAAFLRERLDDRLRGRDDLEVITGAPVLAVVPRVQLWKKTHAAVLISLTQPQSPAAEAYKSLRTGVLFVMQQRKMKVLLVTSPQAGEGKTSTTANLGVALAQAGKKVVMVSADLRKPRLHQFFDVPNVAGLTDVLGGRTTTEKVLIPKTDGLTIFPSGPVPANPAELLASDEMRWCLENLRPRTDVVLIDAPPLLAVTDAAALAPFADGVLFVTDSATTTRGSIKHALKALEALNAPLIGAVLNNFDPAKGVGYGYYGYRSYYTAEDKIQSKSTNGNGSRFADRLPGRRA